MGQPDAIWNSLPIPGLVVDGAGLITAANPAAEQFFNASQRKLRGADISDQLKSDMALGEVVQRVRADRSPVFIKNAQISRLRQSPIACDIHIAHVAGTAGDILLSIQPRHSETRLDQGQTMRSSVRSAIGMAEMLAHEIKNPLAGITGAAQLLAMELDAENTEMTDLIVAESRRIVALLDQVEQFGNLQPPNRVAVNVHDFLERARTSAELGFAADCTIRLDYDPSLPSTNVDSDQMIQVILNLLKNAAEAAGPKGGTLTIRTFFDQGLRRRDADGQASTLPIQVEIIDDGPGLPADLAGDIFEPFVSGRENGTGLGLALVSKIISDHRAWIGVTSEPGHTVFRLSLPLADTEKSTTKEVT